MTEPTPTGAHKVSVVIPTFNNLSLLLECLESVRLQDYPRDLVEIIVVDNASTDRTREILSQRFPFVQLVLMESNTGFAVACNRGAQSASGDYVAFLNNDAIAATNWLSALVSALDTSDDTTVCVASRIDSRDGSETEFDGASSNLFGAGRPTSVWGWPDAPASPTIGTPILFASGGAMLINRQVFLDVGGFDPAYFAYFEDVDLGWRLWLLGYRVIYNPEAVVRHIGGATGKRTGEHRRYVLWESNSLATIIKNYESGTMEQILSAALLLEYRRALLATGDVISLPDYHLGGPRDTNTSNVERLPKVSVAHLAAIDRLNSLLPQLMESRRDIQARRVRSDAEILPLLGRAFEPQYAGLPYARASRALAEAMHLYDITASSAPNRVLIVGAPTESSLIAELANRLKQNTLIATVVISNDDTVSSVSQDGLVEHQLPPASPDLSTLISNSDLLIVLPSAAGISVIHKAPAPVVLIGKPSPGLPDATVITDTSDPRLLQLCRKPM